MLYGMCMTPDSQGLDELARRYEAGETYEELGLDIGVSQSEMCALLKGRVQSRPRGQRPGKPQGNKSNAAPRSKPEFDPSARIVRGNVKRAFR